MRRSKSAGRGAVLRGLLPWALTATLTLGVLVAAGWGVRWVLMPAVTVTDVVRGPVVRAFYATGIVEPRREYPLATPADGVLADVLVTQGDLVTAGQVLASVDDPQRRYDVDRTAAQLAERLARADPAASPVLREFDARIATADALLEIAGRELARVERLFASAAAGESDLDRARETVRLRSGETESLRAQRDARALELERERAVAQAAHAAARWEVERLTLRSPADGVVLDRPRSPGTRVATNDVILRVADVRPDNLVLRAAVDEEDVTNVATAQNVDLTLYSFPGRTLRGRVVRVYDEADAQRRTFQVDVELIGDPPGRLASGMTGELAFLLETRDDVVVVPSQAVQGGRVYVLRDGRVRESDATIGVRSVQRAEVTSGLSPGEHVVISPVEPNVIDRTARVTRIDPRAAAGLNRVEAPTGGGFGAF